MLAVDIFLGTIIGPLNFFGLLIGVALIVANPGLLPRLPAVLGSLITDLTVPSSDTALLFSLPSLLSTAILAPFLVRYLERQAHADPRAHLLIGLISGVVFGFVATFLTGFFMGIAVALQSPEFSGLLPAIGMGLGISLIAGLLLNSMLAPAIIITGSLFGVLNSILIQKMLPRG
ncbi:MAG: hypothetical protein ACRDHG_03895 [Anaerolineales bacterium]